MYLHWEKYPKTSTFNFPFVSGPFLTFGLYALTRLHNFRKAKHAYAMFNPNKHESSNVLLCSIVTCYYHRHSTEKPKFIASKRFGSSSLWSLISPWQFLAAFHHFYLVFSSSFLNFILHFIMFCFDFLLLLFLIVVARYLHNYCVSVMSSLWESKTAIVLLEHVLKARSLSCLSLKPQQSSECCGRFCLQGFGTSCKAPCM